MIDLNTPKIENEENHPQSNVVEKVERIIYPSITQEELKAHYEAGDTIIGFRGGVELSIDGLDIKQEEFVKQVPIPVEIIEGEAIPEPQF
jgi:hypothetical protein